MGLEAVIAGRRIKAQLKEKEEAKQDYDDAIASGFTATFAEEKSGDIFSISLGNLPPKAEAELNLKLVGEIPIDAEGTVRFALPAVLKPRYTPLGSVNPLAQVDSATQGVAPAVHSFKMVVRKEGVAGITSPTHAISCKEERDRIRIALAEEDAKPLDKDLIILVKRTSPHLPSAVCELGNPSFSLLSFMGAPAVMFMESCIESARETLVLFLKSLVFSTLLGLGLAFFLFSPKPLLTVKRTWMSL